VKHAPTIDVRRRTTVGTGIPERSEKKEIIEGNPIRYL
jgi:hypothetical protein